MNYNIGGGEHEIEGYINIDRRHGREAYPLDVPDCSADFIRASHILEHFPYRVVPSVVIDWTNKLRVGGRLRIAVPDFRLISQRYLAGEEIIIQSYIMGGQKDADDYHKTIFDEASLRHYMTNAGLTRIGRWLSEIPDCAGLDISLNLEGWKL